MLLSFNDCDFNQFSQYPEIYRISTHQYNRIYKSFNDLLYPTYIQKYYLCFMWIQITDHPNYSVSDCGEIRNDSTNLILKGQLNSKGYYRVQLKKKHYLLHRIVAIHYIDNPNNLPQVNHLDGNKLNNNKLNLEWTTNKDNQEHALALGLRDFHCLPGELHMNAKYTVEKVLAVRELAKTIKPKEISSLYNININSLYKILKGDLWKHI